MLLSNWRQNNTFHFLNFFNNLQFFINSYYFLHSLRRLPSNFWTILKWCRFIKWCFSSIFSWKFLQSFVLITFFFCVCFVFHNLEDVGLIYQCWCWPLIQNSSNIFSFPLQQSSQPALCKPAYFSIWKKVSILLFGHLADALCMCNDNSGITYSPFF